VACTGGADEVGGGGFEAGGWTTVDVTEADVGGVVVVGDELGVEAPVWAAFVGVVVPQAASASAPAASAAALSQR
jgi:hypothetical protein